MSITPRKLASHIVTAAIAASVASPVVAMATNPSLKKGPAYLVPVYLDQSDTDGNVLYVRDYSIRNVHDCVDGTCEARLEGYNKPVFVRSQDLPITRYHTQEWQNMLPHSMRTPCGIEGENNCYWNAKTMGNGQGYSYIVREFPGHYDGHKLVCIMYVGPHASKQDYCEED